MARPGKTAAEAAVSDRERLAPTGPRRAARRALRRQDALYVQFFDRFGVVVDVGERQFLPLRLLRESLVTSNRCPLFWTGACRRFYSSRSEAGGSEIHWYEAHGVGKRGLKIKRFLD
jgi:hypothetical protein